ncbi:MAG: patatin-like phospholipase family protein [Neisseriaceae bacterium]
MMPHNGLINIFVDCVIIGWLCYSIIVVIYLNSLSHRYLKASSKDKLIGNNKKLKSTDDLLNEFINRDSINVLVLSGGGVRGLVPLHILSYIEKMTGKKIGELFDFFAGSSTGAISVGGLVVADENGQYKFSAEDILANYKGNVKTIFSAPWYHQLLTLFGLFAPRFLPDGKMKVLEGYFADLTLGDLKGNLLIPVYNIENNSLQIIKSWSSASGNSHENFLVKDVINGASSPPMLFPPVAFSVKKIPYMFIDPAVLINNPILHILLYVRSLFPEKRINLVLVGNGGTNSIKYNYKNMFSFGLYGLYQYLFSAPGLSSKLYIEFIEEYLKGTRNVNNSVNFLRINSIPEKDLSSTDISEKNFQQIERFAAKMLHENYEVIEKIIDILSKNPK